MSNYQKAIYNMLYQRPIAYNSGLARALGSVNAAIFVGQLLHWQGKGAKGEWTYKTVDDFEEETGLSKAQQSTVIKLCKKLGILETKRQGIPPVRHFMLYIEKLIELISNSQSLKSRESKALIAINHTEKNNPHNTESTSEKTPYSKLKNQNDFLLRKRKELKDSKQIGW